MNVVSDQVLEERAELLASRIDRYIADGIQSGKTITLDDLMAIILPVLKRTRDEVHS